ncbi:hypothetical protein GN958_ATG04349 [Phytophthora infestans]|uniref:Uncharacterized protein n=1 Tax=Phytophthora infestans TaxID=4787 RepID=A0A8S9V4Z4_PHYIN|nr:hypothetical protein GN958_ATG04349 [Phytophthora infestans]
MEKKRRCVQYTEADKTKALKIWAKNREWNTSQAASGLGVKKSTLLGWRKALSDSKLSFVKEPSLDPGRYRKSGAGPDRQEKSYEDRVLQFYRNCVEGGSKISVAELQRYCEQIPEFAIQNDHTKQNWVWRFIDHYRPIFTQSQMAIENSSRAKGDAEGHGERSAQCAAEEEEGCHGVTATTGSVNGAEPQASLQRQSVGSVEHEGAIIRKEQEAVMLNAECERLGGEPVGAVTQPGVEVNLDAAGMDDGYLVEEVHETDNRDPLTVNPSKQGADQLAIVP